MSKFVQTNALHMDEYKMITKMEAEILRSTHLRRYRVHPPRNGCLQRVWAG